MVKYIEETGHMYFHRRENAPHFLLVFCLQKIVEVLQDGHILWVWVADASDRPAAHSGNDGF